MPTYSISAPDGNTYKIDGPEGASQAQVQAEVLRQHPQAGGAKPGPLGSQIPQAGVGYTTEPAPPQSAIDRLMGTARNLAGGVVEPLAGAAVGAVASPLANVAGLAAIPAHAMGLTNRDPADVRAGVLNSLVTPPTTGGGQAVQGVLGKAGAALEGAGKAVGQGYQSASDAVGLPQGVGEALNNGVSETVNQLPTLLGTKLPAAGKARVAAAAQDAVDSSTSQAAIQAARDSGYPILPAEMRNAPAGHLLSGMAGKNDLNSHFALASQRVTNNIAKQDIGLAANQPLSKATAEARGQVANQGYEAVQKADQNMVPYQTGQTSASGKPVYGMKPAGPMQVDPTYITDVKAIGADRANTALGPIPEVEALKAKLLGAQGAVKPKDALKDLQTLRADARANLKATDDPTKISLGKAQQDAADAVEARVDRYLQSTGQGALMDQFKAARTLKAKVNTVLDNIDAEGNVNASGIQQYRDAGGYVAGGLKSIADAADTLPYVKDTSKVQAPTPVSKLGMYFALAGGPGVGIASGHGAAGSAVGAGGAALLAGPSAARNFLGSKLYQSTTGGQTPAPSMLSQWMARPDSPLAGLAATGQADQQQE